MLWRLELLCVNVYNWTKYIYNQEMWLISIYLFGKLYRHVYLQHLELEACLTVKESIHNLFWEIIYLWICICWNIEVAIKIMVFLYSLEVFFFFNLQLCSTHTANFCVIFIPVKQISWPIPFYPTSARKHRGEMKRLRVVLFWWLYS